MPTEPAKNKSPGAPAPDDTGFDIPDAPGATRSDAADPAQVIRAAAEAKIEALEAELATARDTWMRSAADAQNARRRAKLDVEEAHKFAVSRFAKDLLSVADNLSRALASLPPNGEGLDDRLKNVVTGVQATERELLSVFDRHGIKKIAALGAPFDPQLHQAVSEVQDPTRPNNSVAQVFMDGYTLNDRLLRAAMVVVAKGGPVAAPTSAEPEPANAAVDADGA
ncbi:nucleotide exchange factor GrpE [Reyranella sp. CPCC 100927]|uniref:nucleotide exchange factor GrpE n=1 Tax=Reyranella sp. CPCC 100927 TaxID=2599616 RepID=UPI0011B41D24|nr:nucleotide exchange factor GrpE [Reyranella sp. CPCC 100927]TWT14819.1 nucleotide exchange factor GrpE [Reyranella sp. CPCC 100927]